MRSPFLCLGIVITLGLVSLTSIGGLIVCALRGGESQGTMMGMAAMVSLASGAAGALSSFLVMPPRNSLGIEAIDPAVTAAERLAAVDRHTRANEENVRELTAQIQEVLKARRQDGG